MARRLLRIEPIAGLVTRVVPTVSSRVTASAGAASKMMRAVANAAAQAGKIIVRVMRVLVKYPCRYRNDANLNAMPYKRNRFL